VADFARIDPDVKRALKVALGIAVGSNGRVTMTRGTAPANVLLSLHRDYDSLDRDTKSDFRSWWPREQIATAFRNDRRSKKDVLAQLREKAGGNRRLLHALTSVANRESVLSRVGNARFALPDGTPFHLGEATDVSYEVEKTGGGCIVTVTCDMTAKSLGGTPLAGGKGSVKLSYEVEISAEGDISVADPSGPRGRPAPMTFDNGIEVESWSSLLGKPYPEPQDLAALQAHPQAKADAKLLIRDDMDGRESLKSFKHSVAAIAFRRQLKTFRAQPTLADARELWNNFLRPGAPGGLRVGDDHRTKLEEQLGIRPDASGGFAFDKLDLDEDAWTAVFGQFDAVEKELMDVLRVETPLHAFINAVSYFRGNATLRNARSVWRSFLERDAGYPFLSTMSASTKESMAKALGLTRDRAGRYVEDRAFQFTPARRKSFTDALEKFEAAALKIDDELTKPVGESAADEALRVGWTNYMPRSTELRQEVEFLGHLRALRENRTVENAGRLLRFLGDDAPHRLRGYVRVGAASFTRNDIDGLLEELGRLENDALQELESNGVALYAFRAKLRELRYIPGAGEGEEPLDGRQLWESFFAGGSIPLSPSEEALVRKALGIRPDGRYDALLQGRDLDKVDALIRDRIQALEESAVTADNTPRTGWLHVATRDLSPADNRLDLGGPVRLRKFWNAAFQAVSGLSMSPLVTPDSEGFRSSLSKVAASFAGLDGSEDAPTQLVRNMPPHRLVALRYNIAHLPPELRQARALRALDAAAAQALRGTPEEASTPESVMLRSLKFRRSERPASIARNFTTVCYRLLADGRVTRSDMAAAMAKLPRPVRELIAATGGPSEFVQEIARRNLETGRTARDFITDASNTEWVADVLLLQPTYFVRNIAAAARQFGSIERHRADTGVDVSKGKARDAQGRLADALERELGDPFRLAVFDDSQLEQLRLHLITLCGAGSIAVRNVIALQRHRNPAPVVASIDAVAAPKPRPAPPDPAIRNLASELEAADARPEEPPPRPQPQPRPQPRELAARQDARDQAQDAWMQPVRALLAVLRSGAEGDWIAAFARMDAMQPPPANDAVTFQRTVRAVFKSLEWPEDVSIQAALAQMAGLDGVRGSTSYALIHAAVEKEMQDRLVIAVKRKVLAEGKEAGKPIDWNKLRDEIVAEADQHGIVPPQGADADTFAEELIVDALAQALTPGPTLIAAEQTAASMFLRNRTLGMHLIRMAATDPRNDAGRIAFLETARPWAHRDIIAQNFRPENLTDSVLVRLASNLSPPGGKVPEKLQREIDVRARAVMVSALPDLETAAEAEGRLDLLVKFACAVALAPNDESLGLVMAGIDGAVRGRYSRLFESGRIKALRNALQEIPAGNEDVVQLVKALDRFQAAVRDGRPVTNSLPPSPGLQAASHKAVNERFGPPPERFSDAVKREVLDGGRRVLDGQRLRWSQLNERLKVAGRKENLALDSEAYFQALAFHWKNGNTEEVKAFLGAMPYDGVGLIAMRRPAAVADAEHAALQAAASTIWRDKLKHVPDMELRAFALLFTTRGAAAPGPVGDELARRTNPNVASQAASASRASRTRAVQNPAITVDPEPEPESRASRASSQSPGGSGQRSPYRRSDAGANLLSPDFRPAAPVRARTSSDAAPSSGGPTETQRKIDELYASRLQERVASALASQRPYEELAAEMETVAGQFLRQLPQTAIAESIADAFALQIGRSGSEAEVIQWLDSLPVSAQVRIASLPDDEQGRRARVIELAATAASSKQAGVDLQQLDGDTLKRLFAKQPAVVAGINADAVEGEMRRRSADGLARYDQSVRALADALGQEEVVVRNVLTALEQVASAAAPIRNAWPFQLGTGTGMNAEQREAIQSDGAAGMQGALRIAAVSLQHIDPQAAARVADLSRTADEIIAAIPARAGFDVAADDVRAAQGAVLQGLGTVYRFEAAAGGARTVSGTFSEPAQRVLTQQLNGVMRQQAHRSSRIRVQSPTGAAAPVVRSVLSHVSAISFDAGNGTTTTLQGGLTEDTHARLAEVEKLRIAVIAQGDSQPQFLKLTQLLNFGVIGSFLEAMKQPENAAESPFSTLQGMRGMPEEGMVNAHLHVRREGESWIVKYVYEIADPERMASADGRKPIESFGTAQLSFEVGIGTKFGMPRLVPGSLQFFISPPEELAAH
jgi:hypothetical protein